MNESLKHQVNGLWKIWNEEKDNSIEKDKLSAELAKFIIDDINLENISNIETEDELDDIIDIVVECNNTSLKLLKFYQTVFPAISDEDDEFKDKVALLKDKLDKRVSPVDNKEARVIEEIIEGGVIDKEKKEIIEIETEDNEIQKKDDLALKTNMMIFLLIILIIMLGFDIYKGF